MELGLSSSLLYFFFFFSLFLKHNAALPGTIERATKQQVLAAIRPGEAAASSPFLVSPAGKYAAYFRRSPTAPGAGGFGNDFCYIQVRDTDTGENVWESECAPVSTANTCSLVFSDAGVEVFDGSNSAWDSGDQSGGGNPLQSLELVDEGDMRIRDNVGELAWKASDDPRSNQRCGEQGSPGLAAAMPPFAEPVGGSRPMPFGQQTANGQMVAGVAGGCDGGRNTGIGVVVMLVFICFMAF